MKTQRNIWIATSLLALTWAGSATAVSIGGSTVDAPGGFGAVGSVNGAGETIYYIPLGSDGLPGGTLPGGTYGDTAVSCGLAGTCVDSGVGIGYTTANALFMNIHFDLSGEPDTAAGTLDFRFVDLDLKDVNDPDGFFESISLAYWDGSSLNEVVHDSDNNSITESVYDHTDDLADVGTVTSGGLNDPVTWRLDLAALGVLGIMNSTDNLWIQLGFGSKYVDAWGKPKWGKNTAEYLAATLNVSPVPIPSAVWLFGSALLGFIGMSRRTRV